MARFLGAEWLGENPLEFDVIEAVKVLDEEHLRIIRDLINDPLLP